MSYASILAAQRQNFMNISLIGWSHLGSLIVKNLWQPWHTYKKLKIPKIETPFTPIAPLTRHPWGWQGWRRWLGWRGPVTPINHPCPVVIFFLSFTLSWAELNISLRHIGCFSENLYFLKYFGLVVCAHCYVWDRVRSKYCFQRSQKWGSNDWQNDQTVSSVPNSSFLWEN